MIDSDQSYFEACHPKPIRICGEEIKWISYGHILQLRAAKSDFLTPHWPTFEHFLFALWICTNRTLKNHVTLDLKFPFRWKVASQLLSLIKVCNSQRIDAEISKLKEYIGDPIYSKLPISHRNRDISRESTCPSLLPMKRVLMSFYGYSEQEVLDMPYKQARWEHAAWQEHEGIMEFRTSKEDQLLTLMRSPEAIERNKKFWEENRVLKRN